MADEFGAKRRTRKSYFRRGIERLKIGCNKGYRIALLGAMQDPIRYTRSILVGRQLIK